MNNNNILKIAGIFGIIGLTQSYILYQNYKNHQSNYFNKMKKIIEDKADIKNDIYNRGIDDHIVWKFVNIAKSLDIQLEDDIDEDTFDKIYKIHIDNIIKKSLK